jgi:hypothetical protein
VRLLERIRGPRPAKRLSRWSPPWGVVEESGIGFRRACTRATPRSIRDLVCPDPWSLANYPRPRIPLNASVEMPIASPDLRAVDWRRVLVPGAACGATQPIRLDPRSEWGDAFVRSAARPWWSAVEVAAGPTGVRYGDLDGDGRDEAALVVVCSNAGGTAAGQLAFAM